jgi:serine/threonine protein kinase
LLNLDHRRSSKLVAVKILRAESSAQSKEVAFYKDVKNHFSNEAAKARLLSLTDNFWEAGINGQHLCLVFEPMAYSALDYLMFTRVVDPEERNYRYTNARVIIKDILMAVYSLHTRGIVHGNLNPNNILADLYLEPPQNLRTFVDYDLNQISEHDRTVPVERYDGLDDDWAPKRLCLSEPLWDIKEDLTVETPRMRLADSGAGEPVFTNASSALLA